MNKEPYINLNDFMAAINRRLIKSQVSEEKLVLYSDIEKAMEESRRVEA